MSAILRIACSLLLAAWLAAGLAGSAAAEEALRFVQITDTHLGDRDHLERTRRLVAEINRLPVAVDFVVHTGDIFAGGVPEEAARERLAGAFRALKVPIHFLPGNHDIPAADPGRGAAAYRREVGPLVHRAAYRGVTVVFAYTEPLAQGFVVEGYDPEAEIESALAGAGGGPVVFFHHRPATEDLYDGVVHPGWDPAGRSRLESILRRHPVKAVVTGHFHRDELQWMGDIPVFTSPPVAGYWGRQASFRIYELRDGRLGYRSVYLDIQVDIPADKNR
jgi:3',5'-cyclic AMP phosphodiesterase CpdA